MEYINRLLHRSTANPRISPSPPSGSNESPAPKTAEHEVKVRFAREFADVGSITCSAPESLSSASSFHSLSSTLSTKSSSGICPDSVPDTSDDIANTSYVNSDIPGVENLILACANIHLESEPLDNVPNNSQDLSQDQTFASATDESPFHTSDCSLNEDLRSDDKIYNETRTIETNTQLHETTYLSVNQTHILDPSKNTILIHETQSVIPYSLTERHTPQTEELVEKPILLEESGNATNKLDTCNIVNDIIKDSLPTNSVDNNQLNETTTISLDKSISAINEEQAVETTNHSVETSLSLENLNLCPIEIPAPFTPSIILTQYVEAPSLPSISGTSPLLEDTENKENKNNVHDLPGSVRDSSSSDDIDQKLISSSINNLTIQAENNEIKQQDSSQLDNCFATNNKENTTQSLNKTSIIEPKTLEIQENLQTNIDTQDLEIKHSAVLNETQTFPEEDIAICNETQITEKQNPSEILKNKKIIEKENNNVKSATLVDAAKEKEISHEEDFDRTLTLQEIDTDFATASDEEYLKFKPQRQSTTLSLNNVQLDFEELKFTAEEITNDLLNPSSKFVEETDQFVSAIPEIFQDASTFDFLLAQSNSKHINRLRADSLYAKFDPLVSNINMLPQGNIQPLNEEQNDKNESTLSDVGTPKRNPAIAAIDRLLFYSPLPSGTVQKSEEAHEKNEPPVEEPKSDVPLINDIDMTKELELVRATVLQLEEELEKQKKKHEGELERQKVAFQEKFNKLQAQLAQEVKTKTQMTVVVEEYEKSISRLLTERERDRTNFEQEKAKLQEELQAANHHLTNTEAAFNDVHQKYERLKGVVSVYKNNETVLKESIQENVDTIKTLETRYDQLKDHAMAQLEKANLELDGIRKQNEAETVKLHAMIRKAELKSNSLAELVEQKTKENKELAKILDEVIARVGHGNAE